MAESGTGQPRARISGQTIIDELIRNMEVGRLELAYCVLLPCVFSVYLHPDDLERLRPVRDIIGEDARRALNARLAEQNGKRPLFRRGGAPKPWRIARSDWWIELFADSENAVPPGDVEIHSELNDAPQPGYRGVKTTLVAREPSVTAARVARDRAATRGLPEKVFAEIRYRDDSGPQTYRMTQDQISIGRGGENVWVDLPLYASEEVSREHVRIKRDSASGAFVIVDQSRNGARVNGRKLTRGKEEPLPDRAEIGIAAALKLTFEAKK
jgi:hypothetical protein